MQAYADSKARAISSTGLVHSTRSELETIAEPGWVRLGENLGHGPNLDLIWQAWEASPSHAKNLYGEWTSHALGTYRDPGDGSLWAAHVFQLNPNQCGAQSAAPSTARPDSPPVVSAVPRSSDPSDHQEERKYVWETRMKQVLVSLTGGVIAVFGAMFLVWLFIIETIGMLFITFAIFAAWIIWDVNWG